MKTLVVQDHKSDWKISVPDGADRIAVFAAQELRDLLERMTRCGLPVDREPRAQDCIELVEDDSLPAEGFRIEVAERHIRIGGNGTGTLYGVYSLLESLGCRFVVPGDDCVPFLTAVEIEQGTVEESPDVAWRLVRIIDPLHDVDSGKDVLAQIDWCAKNRINWIECCRGWPAVAAYGSVRPAADRILKTEVSHAAADRGVKIVPFGHSFFRWCPPAEFFEAHPEYFAEIDGERRAVQLCVTNPHVEKLVAERIIRFFDESPEVSGVTLGPQDGDDWCNCANCLDADAPLAESSYKGKGMTKRSRSYFEFINHVAGRVAEKHPDKWILCYAYVMYFDPPDDYVPSTPRISVQYAWYWICGTHPLDDPDCDANVFYWKAQQEWIRKLQGKIPFVAYDYHYGMSGWDLLPWPALRLSAANWKASVPHGVQGCAFQYYKADTVLFRIVDHIWTRFMWDMGTADHWKEELVHTCEAYFGTDVGRLIADYQLELEACAERFDGHLMPTITNNLTRLIHAPDMQKFCEIADAVRAVPAGPHQAGRTARFLWQHDLAHAMWQTMTHREAAEAARDKGDQDEAEKCFRETIRTGLDTMKRWPDNPELMNHAAMAVRMAQEYLGDSVMEDKSLAEDRVAAELLEKLQQA